MNRRNDENGQTLTDDEWWDPWNTVADFRDKHERVLGDADTGEIVDLVEKWLSENGFA